MNPAVKRNFYRKCKEDIDWYLANNDREDYAMLYRLLGSPASSKFVNFEGGAAEELLKELRMYFASKMNGKPCPPHPGPGPGPCPPIPIHELIKILEAIFTKASTTRPGLIRIATDEEALEGESIDTAVTPHSLSYFLEEKAIGKTVEYEHEQGEISDCWEIHHNLGRYPTVTVVDSSGTEIIADVKYIDKNTCVVYMNGEFKGTAYLN